MTNDSLSSSLIKHKWPLLLGAIGLAVVGLFLVLLSSQMLFQNNTENVLPENTCPTEIKQVDGRPKAIYQGKTMEMSLLVYNWVQANCNLGQENAEKPILTSLGVSFGKYNSLSGKAGDFVLNKDTISSNWGMNKVFMDFGAPLPSGVPSPELGYYQLDINAQITAVADGHVVEARYQSESNDFAFSVLFNDNWVINYDHVTNLKFREGDVVQAGQIIGKVSPNKDGKSGYTEISLKETDGRSPAVFHCPLAFLDADVRAEYEAKVVQLMTDWETVFGNTEIYNEANQTIPGCNSLYFSIDQ